MLSANSFVHHLKCAFQSIFFRWYGQIRKACKITAFRIKKVLDDLLVVVGHPLASESGPRESMGVERIVEIWGVLLPDLVLLHHFLLLDVIGVFNCNYSWVIEGHRSLTLFLKRVHNFILSRDL